MATPLEQTRVHVLEREEEDEHTLQFVRELELRYVPTYLIILCKVFFELCSVSSNQRETGCERCDNNGIVQSRGSCR